MLVERDRDLVEQIEGRPLRKNGYDGVDAVQGVAGGA